ncbi:hypothetical protein [Bdellovibrio bacteriovorus]|uniref:hypothetical protein n=1 Tax=Bdellovibrio bacteriovorus TaxID=959 RepID=UPI0035A72C2B
MFKGSVGLTALVSVLFSFNVSHAKEFPVQARLFAGNSKVDPKNVNEVIEAQGLKKIDSVSRYGVEITYPAMKYLDVGVRYTKILGDVEENPASSATDYSAKVDQDALLLLARVPLYRNDVVRFDGFAGVGGTNTKLKVRTASQDGEFTKSAGEGWAASPYTAVGGSLSIGYKKFYFVVEGGIENNKVDGFDRSGSASASIDTLDLSGSYFSVGIMFNGISGSIK